MTEYLEGERVEVRDGLNGRALLFGVVETPELVGSSAGMVYVRGDGKAKPKPFPAARVRRVSRRPAPLSHPLEQPRRTDGGPRPVPRPAPPARDASYLAFVRTHPCKCCGSTKNVEAHHWARRGKGGGMGRKPDDYRTVSLCLQCHRHLHDSGTLEGYNAAATTFLLLAWQVDLLVEWTKGAAS